jgi:ribose-phosphate pyrophosphokinase
MQLYALRETVNFALGVAAKLAVPLEPVETRAFHDGERKIRPLDDPAGADAYVFQSLHGGPERRVHDRLCALLFFIATLKDHGARRVTAVTPYMAYARKERRTKPFDPLGMRYMAQLLEAAGADRILALEPHDRGAFENAFRIPVRILDLRDMLDGAEGPLARWLADTDGPLFVASPDPGGVKRAQLLAEALAAWLGCAVESAFVEKRRSSETLARGARSGGLAGARILLVDDLIVSGATLVRAADAFLESGAAEVRAVAAHGLFDEAAAVALAASPLSAIAVSDAAAPGWDPGPKFEIIPVAATFAAAIADLAKG